MALLTKEVKVNGIMGDFYEFVLGTKVTGNGVLTLDKGFYILSDRVIATTTLPKMVGTSGTDIVAGDMFYSDGTLVASATDTYYPITIISRTDIGSWSLEGSADTGEATTFADIRTDKIKRKMTGLLDLSGSMEGFNTVLVSDAEDWCLNSFFPITVLDGKTSATKYVSNSSTKYGIFVVNKDSQGGTVPCAFLTTPFSFVSSALSGDPTSADGTAIGGDFIIPSDPLVRLGYYVCHNTDELEVLRQLQ